MQIFWGKQLDLQLRLCHLIFESILVHPRFLVSSDICDEYRKKRDYTRSISRSNTMRFRSIHFLLKNNISTFSIAVLSCKKINYPK
jgi:hypothetical protein